MMKNEQKKERDNVGRMEISNLKNSDDFRSVLNQIQSEFQYRLEVKMTDLVNRLLMEQDERLRSVDDIRYQMEMKEKMITEKSKHERDELRDRYSQMDSIVRSEFQRKDEMIGTIQNNLETQIRSINSWIKQEELARAQQEVNIRGEIVKISDSVRYELDGFKGQQSQVTDKLGEMIRVEVDSRLTSDKDIKLLVQNLLKNVMNEVASIKE